MNNMGIFRPRFAGQSNEIQAQPQSKLKLVKFGDTKGIPDLYGEDKESVVEKESGTLIKGLKAVTSPVTGAIKETASETWLLMRKPKTLAKKKMDKLKVKIIEREGQRAETAKKIEVGAVAFAIVAGALGTWLPDSVAWLGAVADLLGVALEVAGQDAISASDNAFEAVKIGSGIASGGIVYGLGHGASRVEDKLGHWAAKRETNQLNETEVVEEASADIKGNSD